MPKHVFDPPGTRLPKAIIDHLKEEAEFVKKMWRDSKTMPKVDEEKAYAHLFVTDQQKWDDYIREYIAKYPPPTPMTLNGDFIDTQSHSSYVNNSPTPHHQLRSEWTTATQASRQGGWGVNYSLPIYTDTDYVEFNIGEFADKPKTLTPEEFRAALKAERER
jgi:hypothetical protein